MGFFWRALLGGLIALPELAIYAQQTTGEITGAVTDTSGAVIEGATVTATNTATQQARTTISNGTGNYVISFLEPGNYAVKCSKTGFELETQPSVEVTVGAVIRADFKMQVGQVTQQITVTTAAPLLSTESTAVETNIGSQQIVALPLNGRDYLQLVALTPNVENEAAGGGGSSLMGGVRDQEAISVAGQRLEFNHYTLDGVENTDPDFNTYIIHPSVDALQEFTVLTGVYSSEYGRGASQINATTLPGTNTYHGVAFDFMRNDAADARIWLQTGAKNPFHRQDYGFVLDGPLSIPHVFDAKNKLFFASSFEHYGDHELERFVASEPTTSMVAGNFSLYSTINPIYFPITRENNPDYPVGPPVQVSYNGVLNVIPPTSPYCNGPCISPQAQAIMKVLYPTVPADSPAGYVNDYVAEEPYVNDQVQFNQRIDWTQNNRSNWFGRFSWENDLDQSASAFPDADSTFVGTTVRQAVIGNTFVVSPRVVNDARVAWDQFNNNYAGYYYDSSDNIPAALGITGFTSAGGPKTYGIPAIGMGQGISGGGGVTPWITYDDLFQFIDDVSYVKGKNSFKFGGSFERDRFNNFGNQKSVGEFDFDGNSTEDPAIGPGTGFVFADFLFGDLSQYYRVSALPQAELRRSIFGIYIQDDWKATHSLTLNLGLRYDNTRPWFDKHNAIINMDIFQSGVTSVYGPNPWDEPVTTAVPGAPPPIITRPGAADCNFYQGIPFQFSSNPDNAGVNQDQFTQCGSGYMGRSTVNPTNYEYGPRIGLDWAPGTKWSFRAGYGIFYMTDITNAVFDMVRNGGGKDGTTLPTIDRWNLALADPMNTLGAPWQAETGSAACPGFTGVCEVAPQIQAFDQHNKPEYVEQYIFNIQRQLTRNVAIDLGYTGNEGHQILRDWDFNQEIPPTCATCLAVHPFAAFGNIQDVKGVDSSVYNAGDIKVTQRLSHGLLYVVAFTVGRAIDFGSAIRSEGGDTLWPDNSYNMRAERGPSEFNVPRRLVGSFVYQLPFGSGKEFAPSNPVVNHVVSGWTVGGIITFAAGVDQNATTLGSPFGTQDNQPDATGVSYIPKNRGITAASPYWNPAAFDYTNPTLLWQEGTMMRMTLYDPGYRDVDANIARTFHIWESHALEFRLEAFNTTNTVNWAPPESSNTTSADFGIVDTMCSSCNMRELQGAIKYTF